VKEALIVSVTDFFTSIFTAVVVFSILGEIILPFENVDIT
jgi:hypothetical protein